MNIYKCINTNESVLIVLTAKNKDDAIQLLGSHLATEHHEFTSFEDIKATWKIIELDTHIEKIEFELDYSDKGGYYDSGYEEEFETRWFNNQIHGINNKN